MQQRRFLSIDVVRATAILLMVQKHFVVDLTARQGHWVWLYDVSDSLGRFSAPMFTFLVGLSLFLWEKKQERQEKDEAKTRLFILKRGAFIFVAGLLFAVFIWLPESIFDWDILTLIGAATLLMYPLRRIPPWAKIALAFIMLIASPPLRMLSGYSSHWSGIEYSYDFTIQDTVLGFLLNGFFPLLPWFVFPLVGYTIGEYYYDPRQTMRLEGWTMPATGLALSVLAIVGYFVNHAPTYFDGYVGDFLFYPASTTFVIGRLGVTILFLWGMHHLLDGRRKAPRGLVSSFFSRYSKYSLTTYIIHNAAHIWPLYVVALLEGEDMWWYYQNALSVPVALMVAMLFMACFYLVLIFWDRYDGKFSFESLLRQLCR